MADLIKDIPVEELLRTLKSSKWFVTYDTRRGIFVERTGFFWKGHTEWSIAWEGPFESKEEARARKEVLNEMQKNREIQTPGKREPKPKVPRDKKGRRIIQSTTIQMKDIFGDIARKEKSRVEGIEIPEKKQQFTQKDKNSITPRPQMQKTYEKKYDSTKKVTPTNKTDIGSQSSVRMNYYLTETIRKPGRMTLMYDLVQAEDMKSAEVEASKKEQKVVQELTFDFKKCIGIMVMDLGIPTDMILPLINKK